MCTPAEIAATVSFENEQRFLHAVEEVLGLPSSAGHGTDSESASVSRGT